MIAGIDPGQTGAIAFIYPNGKVEIHDTPIEKVKKGKRIKTEYLPGNMSDLLKGLEINHVYIESVHAMPGQGVTSMFNFGKGFGIWIGILAALKIPYTLIPPQAWKKHLMQGMKDKDAARIRAQQLYPSVTKELSRKKDVGRADALLIAEYGRLISTINSDTHRKERRNKSEKNYI